MLEKACKSSVEGCLSQLDVYVKQVHDALQPGSVLLLLTGQGNSIQQRLKEVSSSLPCTSTGLKSDMPTGHPQCYYTGSLHLLHNVLASRPALHDAHVHVHVSFAGASKGC